MVQCDGAVYGTKCKRLPAINKSRNGILVTYDINDRRQYKNTEVTPSTTTHLSTYVNNSKLENTSSIVFYSFKDPEVDDDIKWWTEPDFDDMSTIPPASPSPSRTMIWEDTVSTPGSPPSRRLYAGAQRKAAEEEEVVRAPGTDRGLPLRGPGLYHQPAEPVWGHRGSSLATSSTRSLPRAEAAEFLRRSAEARR